TLITTDVPLLFFWAVLLLAMLRLSAPGAWRWAILAGIAGGLGLLAKYAMLFALVGVTVYLAWVPAARTARIIGRLEVAGFIAGLIVLPNVVWNLRNGFSTIRHTAELALLDRPQSLLASAGEFLGSQIAIFGIILATALAWRLFAWRREPGDDRERLLL